MVRWHGRDNDQLAVVAGKALTYKSDPTYLLLHAREAASVSTGRRTGPSGRDASPPLFSASIST